MSSIDMFGPGGGAPPMDFPMGNGPPPEELLGPPPAEGGGDPVEMMREALRAVQVAQEVEPDEQDTLMLAKIVSMIQQYIASQQQMVDKAMGDPGLMKLMRKTPV